MNLEKRIQRLEQLIEKSKNQNYYDLNPKFLRDFGFKKLKPGDKSNFIYRVLGLNNLPDSLDYKEFKKKNINILRNLKKETKEKFEEFYNYEKFVNKIFNCLEYIREVPIEAPNSEFFEYFLIFLFDKRYYNDTINNVEINYFLNFYKDNADFRNVFSQFKIKFKQLLELRDQYANNKIKKIATQVGLTPIALMNGYNEINRYTLAQFRKINPRYYKLLKFLTVDKNNIPKTLYRGLFIPRDKISNLDEFLSKWGKGSFPKEDVPNPTSWSENKSIAIAFSKKLYSDKVISGYHIILRLDNPTYDEILADFRKPELPTYSALELIVEPSVTRYKVEDIFSSENESEYKDYTDKNTTEFGVAIGYNFELLVQRLFKFGTGKTGFSLDTRINIAKLKDLNWKEVSKNYPSKKYNDLIVPLYVLIYEMTESGIFPFIQDSFKVSNKEIILYLAKYDINIKLIQNEFRQFIFQITLIQNPTEDYFQEIKDYFNEFLKTNNFKNIRFEYKQNSYKNMK